VVKFLEMRSAKCPDGKRRILTKIEVPMDVNDIASFAWSALAKEDESNSVRAPVDIMRNLNKREILRLAKKTVKEEGTAETTNYPAEVLQHVKRMFPEVD